MSAQLLAVVIIVALATGYAAWRIFQAIGHANDPCQGCAGCALKEQVRKNGHTPLKTGQKQLKEQQKTGCYHKK